ncbi:serine/threonine protein kinase [Aetokthonos hydrillicola Thurmond2011]|jgi:serine/threonine protein kinase|uniref:non-specific serine/threonine protein kinase n=1 Tax=Aetokthonos hydrillicola Thurmond2011 TaxID=2712845 RepID=A0AAP5IAW5_9CYAN|nr:serine/threonine-protein kinase [Aetokthonos hydrillicola]MBO3460334.1 serine/threonine protein kinase [Aetokthonos hydrillicola CCALA 1050]MBW4590788.1 serine/threonine protein kinase [Aetokthonos hydrillicola CCALA 1050]MDR9898051.1 serine/threonine protein kinase [Aetokthonos hydrillicola Thurmond2011]
MSYCLNPGCPKPDNTNNGKFCLACGSKLLLKERYRAIQPIGQGGFGRTFLAVDEDKPSKPRCVIKQFYPQAQGTSTLHKAEELFTQEAMRLDDLGKNPQIPELLAYFTQDDRQYLVQEFINGQNLEQELAKNGIFNEAQIWQLLNNLLPVLQFCHTRQVIHRDIKPENIIRRLPQGDLVLVDFGAAKIATYTALNTIGTRIGSPEYVAPEQIRGQAVFASDIYSLGVTCIHLLTQRSPFDLYDVHNDAWIWQNYLKTPISNNLSSLLEKMLKTAVIERYQTVDEVVQQLATSSRTTTATSPPKAGDQIDLELEEMKTIFLKGGKPQTNTNTQFQTQKPQRSNTSKIDDELEELKSQYLGNNNP